LLLLIGSIDLVFDFDLLVGCLGFERGSCTLRSSWEKASGLLSPFSLLQYMIVVLVLGTRAARFRSRAEMLGCLFDRKSSGVFSFGFLDLCGGVAAFRLRLLLIRLAAAAGFVLPSQYHMRCCCCVTGRGVCFFTVD
jgi:hypothetical protein